MNRLRARHPSLMIASFGCEELASMPKSSADAFRRPLSAATRRGLRTGPTDGLRTTGKPKALQKNRCKKLKPPSKHSKTSTSSKNSAAGKARRLAAEMGRPVVEPPLPEVEGN